MAKKIRGEANITPFRAPKVEIATNADTRTTPTEPNRTLMVSAATSGERRTVSTGMT
jgi:hypothetical protein